MSLSRGYSPIAKPRYGAASKHITESCIQDLWHDLAPDIHRLLSIGEDVLVEEFIDGSNVSLPVLGGSSPKTLPAYKLVSPKKGQLVTYDQKRQVDRSLERSLFDNPTIGPLITTRTLALHQEIEPIDYFRVDFRVLKDSNPVFLEFNVCCNIASTSGFAYSAQQHGLSHRDLIVEILRYSFGRQEIHWQPL